MKKKTYCVADKFTTVPCYWDKDGECVNHRRENSMKEKLMMKFMGGELIFRRSGMIDRQFTQLADYAQKVVEDMFNKAYTPIIKEQVELEWDWATFFIIAGVMLGFVIGFISGGVLF